MRERLSVEPQGLAAASASLSGEATTLQAGASTSLAADRTSTFGAADVVTAIEHFSAAYAERLRTHAQSMSQALASYTAADASAGADIDAVAI